MAKLNFNTEPSDPIYTNLFYCEFTADGLSENNKNLLSISTFFINTKKLGININQGKKSGIPILKILDGMKDFSIKVVIHNKVNEILGMYKYTGCNWVNLYEDTISYDWESANNFGLFDQIVKPIIRFKVKEIEYVDATDFKSHEREMKLRRVLEEPKHKGKTC